MTTIYTLDTNFFIDAKNRHFQMCDKCDMKKKCMDKEFCENFKFWDWLLELADKKIISVTQGVYDEICGTNINADDLSSWLANNKEKLVDNSQNYLLKFDEVMRAYVGNEGKKDEMLLDKLKADPYVIAQALYNNSNGKSKGCVVTAEIPNKATAAHNKKISSICNELNIPYFTFSRFFWEVKHLLPNDSNNFLNVDNN